MHQLWHTDGHSVNQGRSYSTSGFTLLELMVVMVIITAIMAMTIPAVSSIRLRQSVQATAALLNTVTSAMASYNGTTIGVPLDSTGNRIQQRQLWDFNESGILDGRPEDDPAFTASEKTAAAEAGYRGPLLMLGLTLPSQHTNQYGQILDSWNEPLRVAEFPLNSGRLQVWSLGPDREADTDADGDDIKPWRSRND